MGFVSLARWLFLMWDLGPTAEELSFARPKESSQRKGRPAVAKDPCAPRFQRGSTEGISLSLGRRAKSISPPFGPFPPKAAVLGATERDWKIKSQKLKRSLEETKWNRGL
jgi:hypothetical protein